MSYFQCLKRYSRVISQKDTIVIARAIAGYLHASCSFTVVKLARHNAAIVVADQASSTES